jgi:hypothetical protein
LPRRALLLALLALGTVLFLAISALLARVLSLDSDERAAITALLQAEARGDQREMTALMYRCGGSCRARLRDDARALRRPGSLQIAQLTSSAGFSLTATLGTARVAWTAGGSLPIVQCVRVRRAGNVISGFRIELLALSVRIRSDAACPRRF